MLCTFNDMGLTMCFLSYIPVCIPYWLVMKPPTILLERVYHLLVQLAHSPGFPRISVADRPHITTTIIKNHYHKTIPTHMMIPYSGWWCAATLAESHVPAP